MKNKVVMKYEMKFQSIIEYAISNDTIEENYLHSNSRVIRKRKRQQNNAIL